MLLNILNEHNCYCLKGVENYIKKIMYIQYDDIQATFYLLSSYNIFKKNFLEDFFISE